MTETLPGSSAEVIRIPRQSFLAIGYRSGKLFHHVAYGRSLIPAFGKIWSSLDDPTEQSLRFGELVLLHRFDPGAKNPLGFGIAGATPGSPENRFRRSGKLPIVAFECSERILFVGGVHGKNPFKVNVQEFNVGSRAVSFEQFLQPSHFTSMPDCPSFERLNL
jgi:hypothetical protein